MCYYTDIDILTTEDKAAEESRSEPSVDVYGYLYLYLYTYISIYVSIYVHTLICTDTYINIMI